jgi:hypothetical protein
MKLLTVFSIAIGLLVTPDEGWALFARAKFKSTYFKEQNEHFLVPSFDQLLLSKRGVEIQIKGHYMPIDMKGNSLILSRYPYSSCFFCGGAGPESVAEIVLKDKKPKLKADQVITVKGRLRLNDSDINHLNFVLEEAEIVPK